MLPRYHEIDAKSLTRVPGIVDPWFLARYGLNLYRGCEHGCLYCDGRAERYYVEGEFERDIVVKRNAAALLERELGRAREPGFVMLGGGVCDAYQPADARFALARGVLDVVLQRGLPVHVLTKSALVERDLDLLASIQQKCAAILSFSIQTVDDAVRRRFEPGAASVDERFRLLGLAKARGLGIGVMAMPVLPGISDQPEAIERLVARAADAGVDFACFGGLTLRPGRQQDCYFAAIREGHAELVPGYERLYRQQRPSGQGVGSYYARVDERFRGALARHGLPGRIPRRLFRGLLPLYAEAGVLLEHRGFALGASVMQQARTDGAVARGQELARSGMAVQQWARQAIARRGRSKEFSVAKLEAEFRAMVHDGSLAEACGLSAFALGELRAILTLPRAAPRGS